MIKKTNEIEEKKDFDADSFMVETLKKSNFKLPSETLLEIIIQKKEYIKEYYPQNPAKTLASLIEYKTKMDKEAIKLIVKKWVSKEEEIQYLSEEIYNKVKIDASNIAREARDWFDPSRIVFPGEEYARKICFAFELDTSESNALLCKLNRRRIIPINSWDKACMFCLDKGFTYVDALCLKYVLLNTSDQIKKVSGYSGYTSSVINDINGSVGLDDFTEKMKKYVNTTVSRTQYKAFIKWSNYLLLLIYDYQKNIKKDNYISSFLDKKINIIEFENKIMDDDTKLDEQLLILKKFGKKVLNEDILWEMISNYSLTSKVLPNSISKSEKKSIRYRKEKSKRYLETLSPLYKEDIGLFYNIPTKEEISLFKNSYRFNEKVKKNDEIDDSYSKIQDWISFIMIVSYYCCFMKNKKSSFRLEGNYWPYNYNSEYCIKKINNELEKAFLPKLDKDVPFDFFIEQCVNNIPKYDSTNDFEILKKFISKLNDSVELDYSEK